MCPCLPGPLIPILQTRWDFVQDSIPCGRKYSQSEYKKAVVQFNPKISNSQGKWEIVQNNEFEIAASKLPKKKSKGKWFWVWNTKEFKISEFELARSNCIFDGVEPDLPIMYQTKVPLMLATVFPMAWWCMQSSLVEYHGISYLSLVLFWYAHLPKGFCV